MSIHSTQSTIHRTLSVVLATLDEEENIGPCLETIKGIADEIIVVDEESEDKTVEIAEKHGAKVYRVKHQPIFHITKQKALDMAKGDWILQLDADERVTPELAKEIKYVLSIKNNELREYEKEQKQKYPGKAKLFLRHQRLIEKREGHLGKSTREVVAFFVPRRNYFLGKPLIHAGVYPDGVIRLIKKGKASFPAKSVHELMEIDGEVAWLYNDLEHHDSPTFKRYLDRMNRYTDLHAEELKQNNIPANFFYLFLYTTYKPLYSFLILYIRHKGYLDGMRGFVWSLLSSLHYPLAYFKYWQDSRKD
jgi:glycosyltransferase involved in cell wall biosynthesis